MKKDHIFIARKLLIIHNGDIKLSIPFCGIYLRYFNFSLIHIRGWGMGNRPYDVGQSVTIGQKILKRL